jgi:hypothetical protein
MPERPDLRLIAGNIREALADYDREALLDILTHVFKEYVVESPPPILTHAAERIEDLEGLSFAALITALQTRFDHPELELFQVEGERVGVRVQGVLQPLTAADAARARQSRAGADAVRATAPGEQAAPRAGVQVVETTLERRPATTERHSVAEAVARGRGDLAGMERGTVEGQAPRPTRGLSVAGRPTGAAVMDRPSGAPGQQRQEAQPSAPAQQPPSSEEPPSKGGDDDDASIRFSLLEFD